MEPSLGSRETNMPSTVTVLFFRSVVFFCNRLPPKHERQSLSPYYIRDQNARWWYFFCGEKESGSVIKAQSSVSEGAGEPRDSCTTGYPPRSNRYRQTPGSLIESPKKSAIGSRERLLGSAQVLLGENAPLHLQTEVVQQRRCTLMRLNGNIEDSIRLIDEFISREPSAPAELMGPLSISQAKNFAYNFSLSEAHEQAKKYVPRFRRTPRAAVGSCLAEEMRASQGQDASKGYRRILLSFGRDRDQVGRITKKLVIMSNGCYPCLTA
ncbi:hypothetical protein B0T16DRAFT_13873 [Cercophora newfieldiana]|uniref:Uncharacterized protein n=1 Tax=Cercophora newfieldiana TaxID=92897 RepID=A0AA39YN73_9PEZI|nr:hypothetical protein B0T16DRAFT_13873 [Cercophora newfieldiana]